jgi:hypothetical protein
MTQSLALVQLQYTYYLNTAHGIYVDTFIMSITLRVVVSDKHNETFEVYSDTHVLATCQLHFSKDNKKLNLYTVKLNADVKVEQFVEAITCFATTNKIRVIEYPAIVLYDDQSFKEDLVNADDIDELVSYDDPVLKDEKSFSDYTEYQKHVSEMYKQADCVYADKCKEYRNNNLSTAFQIAMHVRSVYDNALLVQLSNTEESNVYTVVHILVDTQVTKRDSQVPFAMGVTINCVGYKDNVEYDNMISGNANIYTQQCSKEVWVYKRPNYKKVINVLNVDLAKSMFFVLACDNLDDVYVGLKVKDITIDTKTKCDYFRLNKWYKYSDIETYDIREINDIRGGYSKKKLYVINRLCFPGEIEDKDYIDYTTIVYDRLLCFAQSQKPVCHQRQRYQVQKTKQEKQDTRMSIKKERATSSTSCELTQNHETTDGLGYIYLIREREFQLRNENVYKVGRTIQSTCSLQLRRLNDYKKGSELCLVRQVSSAKVAEIETLIKAEFRKLFQRHADGHEYFHGDMEQMIDIINSVCVQHRNE